MVSKAMPIPSTDKINKACFINLIPTVNSKWSVVSYAEETVEINLVN